MKAENDAELNKKAIDFGQYYVGKQPKKSSQAEQQMAMIDVSRAFVVGWRECEKALGIKKEQK